MIVTVSESLQVNKIALTCTVTVLLRIATLMCSAEQESSSVVSMVCPGDNLTVSCSTNGSALRWRINISLTPLYLIREQEPEIRSFSRGGPEIVPPIIINQTVLHFSKISSLPLVSVVTIDNVTTDMNQTKIECQGGMPPSTSIHIIDYTMVPVVINEESFGANNVAITLEWFQNGVVFNDVLPPALVRWTGNRSVQLTIPYNIEHDVRFAVCGQPSPETINLHYIVCDEPTSDDLTVINYTAPAREDSIIVIECLLDDSVDASNHTSTCVDGRWEPNLGQVAARCRDTDQNEFDRAVILGASLSASLLILVAGILFIAIVVNISVKKCSTCVHKPNLSLSIPRNQQEHNLSNHYLGEYSEITLQSQNDGVQTRTLVYADLGPLSYEKRKPFAPASILDDDRIEYAQLNTKLSAKEVQKSRAHREDITCIALDLDSLLIQLQPEVNDKWYQFGEAIGIEKKILDKYLSYPPDQNMIEVCDYWLRNHTGQPTWNEVAAALKQIGFQQLACGIEKVYETGRLPKEVNMNEAVNVKSNLIFDESEQPPPIPPRLI